jgi:hypothetical protein
MHLPSVLTAAAAAAATTTTTTATTTTTTTTTNHLHHRRHHPHNVYKVCDKAVISLSLPEEASVDWWFSKLHRLEAARKQ